MKRLGLLAALVLAATTSAWGDQEAWDAIYLGGSKIGHTHLKIEPVKDARGRELVRVRIDYEMNLKRGNDVALLKQAYGTIETPDGSVLRLDTRTFGSTEELRTHGEVANGQMTLTITSGGREQSKVIPWGPDVRGPYGAEMSLVRQPIQPGESREIKTYIPDLNQVCLTRLKAVKKEETSLGGSGPRELLRVEQVVADARGKPLPGMNSTLWVDEGGQILKTTSDLLGGLVSYRTTREAALSRGGGDFNLLTQAILKVKRPFTDFESTRHVVYRVSLASRDPVEVFPTDRRQTVAKGDSPGTAVLEVRTAGRDAGTPGPDAVDEEYLRPNPLVDSKDARVAALARQAVAGRTDPWDKAVAVQDWVHKNLRKKNFSTAFAPAHEVARNLTGDCSEHGVLVAAMCRAVGVPARCVVGLVYVPTHRGFGPHMWNEVYVNRRWVAIDAAYHQSEVDATHIKLADSSLDGVAPFEALLPVIHVFEKMTIEPVEVR